MPALAVVPPISRVRTFSSESLLARCFDERMPAAGPDSIIEIGRSAAWARVLEVPSEFMM